MPDCFLSAAAWFEPFTAHTANVFKIGSEVALLMTLTLIVLLKVDLSKEDIPRGVETVGALLFIVNTVPMAASLVVALLTFGLGESPPGKEKGSDNVETEMEDNPVADSQ